MNQPQVIFLDAVGTIFGVRGSVGQIYADIAAKFGVTSDAQLVDRSFFNCFKASPPLAFPEHSQEEIPELEFQWWKAIAYNTFDSLNSIPQFSSFDRFFDELYFHFSTGEPWFIYPDVIPCLNYWQEQGIELGIISNFDSRIEQVLEALKLQEYFASITISSRAGAAKPEAKIFEVALEKHDSMAEQSWYIGDSFKEDYFGAKKLGIKSFLINRG